MKVDVNNLSKLAEMRITEEQKQMLEAYIPEAIKLFDKLLTIQVPENITNKALYSKQLNELRQDTKTEYDQIRNLEITVPRMVSK